MLKAPSERKLSREDNQLQGCQWSSSFVYIEKFIICPLFFTSIIVKIIFTRITFLIWESMQKLDDDRIKIQDMFK